MTSAQAEILARMACGDTLTHSLVGERLWSLRNDPFTVFDDVSPRLLLAAGLIELARRGSVADDRADAYRLTTWGDLLRHRVREPPGQARRIAQVYARPLPGVAERRGFVIVSSGPSYGSEPALALSQIARKGFL